MGEQRERFFQKPAVKPKGSNEGAKSVTAFMLKSDDDADDDEDDGDDSDSGEDDNLEGAQPEDEVLESPRSDPFLRTLFGTVKASEVEPFHEKELLHKHQALMG